RCLRTAQQRGRGVRSQNMLAAGRSIPAATAVRRTAAAKSASAFVSRASAAAGRRRPSARTLSSEGTGTPGTVAGARATASAGGFRLRSSVDAACC
ncbi:unnamed protein product, partial [Ectocarpus sp. 6 AP-2014]